MIEVVGVTLAGLATLGLMIFLARRPAKEHRGRPADAGSGDAGLGYTHGRNDDGSRGSWGDPGDGGGDGGD